MKFKLLIFFLLLKLSVFSQTDIYFYRDSSNNLSLEKVKDKEFKLLNNTISEGRNNFTYWFKIPKKSVKEEFYLEIENRAVDDSKLYYGLKKIEKIPFQRYCTFKFFSDKDVYFKIVTKRDAHFPISINKVDDYIEKEKSQNFFFGFFYGFVLMVILYNLSFFLVFKDQSFLFYALLVLSICLGLLITNGYTNIIGMSFEASKILSVSIHILVAFFSAKFSNIYLQVDNYIPKLKKVSYTIGVAIILFGALYLFTDIYGFYILLKVCVFLLLAIYWLTSLYLFKKNIFIKIYFFAFFFYLFLGIDLFVLKFLGISVGSVSPIHIKIAGLLQMIVLSFAVSLRLRILNNENLIMTEEIKQYTKELKKASDIRSIDDIISKLSSRELQIYNLIIDGKSNKEIANSLNISINTVKFHIKNIYEKLKVNSRKEVISLVQSEL